MLNKLVFEKVRILFSLTPRVVYVLDGEIVILKLDIDDAILYVSQQRILSTLSDSYYNFLKNSSILYTDIFPYDENDSSYDIESIKEFNEDILFQAVNGKDGDLIIDRNEIYFKIIGNESNYFSIRDFVIHLDYTRVFDKIPYINQYQLGRHNYAKFVIEEYLYLSNQPEDLTIIFN